MAVTRRVEAILESPIMDRPENAELLSVVLRLKTRFRHQGHVQSTYRRFKDVLSVANTLEDRQLIRHFAALVALISPSGNVLLELVMAESLDYITSWLMLDHWTYIAVGKFDWLNDLRAMGYSFDKMLGLLLSSKNYYSNSNSWVTSEDLNLEGDHPGELDPDLHQHHCVHKEGPAIDQLLTLTAPHDGVDWEQCTDRRDKTLRVASAYCGFAGVIPDWQTGTIFAPGVDFRDSYASVSYFCGQKQEMNDEISAEEAKKQRNTEAASKWGSSGKMGKTHDQEDPNDRTVASHEIEASFDAFDNDKHVTTQSVPSSSRPKALGGHSPSIEDSPSAIEEGKSSRSIIQPTQPLQRQTNERYTLTTQEVRTIELLKKATTRLCNAAKVLQNGEMCCNTFTMVVFRESPKLRGNVVDLVSVSFQKLKDFHDTVSALRIEPTEEPPSLRKDLLNCSAVSLRLLRIFAPLSTLESVHHRTFPDLGVESHLHVCSLVTQFLALGLVFYAQGHVGPYSPFFLEKPLTEIMLTGITYRGFYIKAYLQELTCLGKMLGGPVFVFALLSRHPTGSQNLPSQPASSSGTPLDLCGRGIDLADTWGPGLLISRPETAYGHQVYAIELGGGVVRRVVSQSREEDQTEPLCHWSPQYDKYKGMRTQATFSCWDGIRIGRITTRLDCPLDPERYRKKSEQVLANLGTTPDYWQLAERQVALQAGYYAVFQFGNTFARKFGVTIKQQILEQWSLKPSIHNLDVPWGLQVSLCTRVARRVSLRTLIGDSILSHIDTLEYGQWQTMLPKAQEAFRGLIDFDNWIEGLCTNEKSCLIAVIAYALRLLKSSGVDRNAKALSVLWPHKNNESYGIRISHDGSNSWARMLVDSESCATFAAVTSLCLEGHGHKCRNVAFPSWQEAGGFLSTAVCQDSTAEKHMMAMPSCSRKLTLEDGQRYWVGKVGGDHLVSVHKKGIRDVCLSVRDNRIPKAVSKLLVKNVIREKPGVTFDAEDVLVVGDGVSISGTTLIDL